MSSRPDSVPATPNLGRDDLIARARDMIPELRARAAEAEALRRLPDATNAAFHAAGLYRMYQPRAYGGYEMDYQAQIDVAAEIGRGCGSSAWVLSIVASHSWVHGMMTREAQDEMWAKTPEAIIASAFPSRGASATEVAGGLLLDGRWSFASGVDHCEWTHVNVLVPRADGPPQHYFAAVPAADYTIIDDWHVAGMRGTGSKSIELKKAFVPSHRAIDTHACIGGPTAGSAIHPGPLFRMPLFALFAHGIVGPAIGMALGAFDGVAEPMRHARLTQGGQRVGEQPTVQVRLAEASAEIDAARALLKAASDEATELASRDIVPPLEQRVRWRRNAAYAGALCLRAVERLYPLAGANGLADASPFQRAFRDVHAACAHIALTWDVQAANYGAVLLGGPSSDPKL
jgi:3-hydroxy-9,10-secoandrosta-1,3,5(10)-triene-9,17-dione monooxygenase